MLSLPDVTLIAVSSVELDETLIALSISSHEIEFGEIKFLTSDSIIPFNTRIKVEQIPNLDFRGYSKFILKDLHRYVSTSYCLVIQADGFILNPYRWQDRFLDYDYIGAPWPQELTLYPNKQVLDMKKIKLEMVDFLYAVKSYYLQLQKLISIL